MRIETLAREAGLSLSAFHAHFRSITLLTPLQFQKRPRLIKARRRMLAGAKGVSDAAYGVDHQSTPQFTREFSRMFGQPPTRKIRLARATRAAEA